MAVGANAQHCNEEEPELGQEQQEPLCIADDNYVRPRLWGELPPELTERIASFLPRNEVACTLRLVCKSAAALFSREHYILICVGEPVPHHAFLHRWGRPGSVRNLTLRQRRCLLRQTARSGCIPNLQLLLDCIGCPATTALLTAAASAGQQATCEWLHQRGCRWSEAVMRAAAATGSVHFCQWLLDAGCPFDDQALAAAAATGHRQLCEWMVTRCCTWRSSVPRAAAEAGHVDLLDYLLRLHRGRQLSGRSEQHQQEEQQAALDEPPLPPLPPPPAGLGDLGAADVDAGLIIASVAAGCALPVLRRLHARLLYGREGHEGSNDDDSNGGGAVAAAAAVLVQNVLPRHIQLRIMTSATCSCTADWREKVTWLAGQGYPLAVDCWGRAAPQPDWLDRLQWLRQQGFGYDIRAVQAAARYGKLDALQYLLSEGVRVDRYEAHLVGEAVRHGRLAVLQELHRRGWSMEGGGESVQQAAGRGHMDVVVWLVETLQALAAAEEEKAPTTTAVAATAAANGADGGTSGAAADGGGWSVRRQLTAAAATAAAGSGNLALLRWLYGRGCPVDENTFMAAAEWGSEDMLVWLAAAGCRMGATGEPYIRAARTGDLATLRCLRRLGCPWSPSGSTFTRAVANGCALSVLQWLHAEGCPVNWGAAVKEAQRPWRNEGGAVLTWLKQQRRTAGWLQGGGAAGCLGWWWARRPGWCDRVVLLAAAPMRRLRELAGPGLAAAAVP